MGREWGGRDEKEALLSRHLGDKDIGGRGGEEGEEEEEEEEGRG